MPMLLFGGSGSGSGGSTLTYTDLETVASWSNLMTDTRLDKLKEGKPPNLPTPRWRRVRPRP